MRFSKSKFSFFKTAEGGRVLLHVVTEVGLANGHQKRGGNAFSGNVCDADPELSRREFVKIIKVTSDLGGWQILSVDFQTFGFGRFLGEEKLLNLLGQSEVGIHA